MAQIFALAQETLEVDGVTYMATALPATVGLEIQEELMAKEGKPDIALIKKLIVNYVSVENKVIDNKTFDIIFSRKSLHMYKLVDAIIKWNFEDVFTESGIEEK